MMNHVRPYKIFQQLGDNNKVSLTIPTERGTESLTVMTIDTLLLIAVARIMDVQSVLEIGTGRGYTALHLVQNTPARVTTIDHEKKPAVFERTEWAPRIHPLNMLVEDVYPIPSDMVFCDINPTLELCRIDTALAFACEPKVIAWHDYGNPDYPAQSQNLDELAKTHEIYHVEDTWMCFWFADGRTL